MTNETALIQSGQTATEGFGTQALTQIAETHSTALAAQAQAEVQARWIIAMKKPRDLMLVREKLLADCRRPGFAETAIYSKPVGGQKIEGPSIRFAESAMRALGNIIVDTATIYDDARKLVVRVSVTDLEGNGTQSENVVIEKTIERAKPMPGRKILSQRQNSRGSDVFVIEATNEEIIDKVRALVSKARRGLILGALPGDIKEEGISACYATRRGEIAKDPAVARKKMVDAYAGIGVSVAQLAEYLGHSIETADVNELDELKSIGVTIKEGETTWVAVMEAKRGERDAPADSGTAKPLADKLADKAAKVVSKPTPKPAAPKAEPATTVDPETGETVPAFSTEAD